MSTSDPLSQIDLTKLKLPQLRELAARVERHIAERTTVEKASLLAEFEKRAKEEGFTSLADILPPVTALTEPEAPEAASRVAVPPKYRNPADQSQTWTGRGRKPKWVQAHEAAGGTLEQLAIPAV